MKTNFSQQGQKGKCVSKAFKLEFKTKYNRILNEVVKLFYSKNSNTLHEKCENDSNISHSNKISCKVNLVFHDDVHNCISIFIIRANEKESIVLILKHKTIRGVI